MATETERFLKKLRILDEIWETLANDSHVDNDRLVHELRQRGRKVAASVRQEGNLNAGGKFEWVDSVLIKVSFLDCVFPESRQVETDVLRSLSAICCHTEDLVCWISSYTRIITLSCLAAFH